MVVYEINFVFASTCVFVPALLHYQNNYQGSLRHNKIIILLCNIKTKIVFFFRQNIKNKRAIERKTQ